MNVIGTVSNHNQQQSKIGTKIKTEKSVASFVPSLSPPLLPSDPSYPHSKDHSIIKLTARLPVNSRPILQVREVVKWSFEVLRFRSPSSTQAQHRSFPSRYTSIFTSGVESFAPLALVPSNSEPCSSSTDPRRSRSEPTPTSRGRASRRSAEERRWKDGFGVHS